MERRQIASLDVLELRGDPSGPIVILFHGYGASAHDLSPLHREIGEIGEIEPLSRTTLEDVQGRDKQLSKINWYFPNGFVKVPIAPNMYGRAWFPIDLAALENALREGRHRDVASSSPEGLEEAQGKASEMIFQIMEEHGEESRKKLIIGGFSQGAMLSTQICLQLEEKYFQNLLVLSGTLLAREEWTKLAQKKSQLSFFQSHGENDPILPFCLAEELHSILSLGDGSQGKFVSFMGGHEIPYSVLQALREFLFSI